MNVYRTQASNNTVAVSITVTEGSYLYAFTKVFLENLKSCLTNPSVILQGTKMVVNKCFLGISLMQRLKNDLRMALSHIKLAFCALISSTCVRICIIWCKSDRH